jgi:acyl carrier protein
MNTKDRVRSFIVSNFYIPDASLIADDASLLERGIIDSTGILEIISFVEDAFGIDIDERDIVPANLDSVSGIVSFIARKSDKVTARPEALAS